ncbi:MAG: hypothetical protein ACP5MC_01300 [Candidatus Micrarchaeia archaeon]
MLSELVLLLRLLFLSALLLVSFSFAVASAKYALAEQARPEHVAVLLAVLAVLILAYLMVVIWAN